MGHYDECRDGYCGACGQTVGNCEHTNKALAMKYSPEPKKEGSRMIDCMAIVKLGNTYCKECQRHPVCKHTEVFTEYVKMANESIPEGLREIVQNGIRCNFFLQEIKTR
jgi:hypothetical protein